MRLGIIGGGKIGGTVAGLAVAAGHDVALANSRGPETLADLVGQLGPRARAGSVEEAIAFADVVLLAIPLGSIDELPVSALAGKVAIDATNYFPQYTGRIAALEGGATSSSELVASRFAGAAVVKSFNTLYYEVLRDRGGAVDAAARVALPLAGDDPAAKAQVAELIASLGFAPVDTGDLATGGRLLEPGGPFSGAVLSADEARAALTA